MITSKAFWLGAAERAVKTFFQTLVAVIGVQVGAGAIGSSAGVEAVAWIPALSVALLAALLSVATSIGNADFTAGTTSMGVPEA